MLCRRLLTHLTSGLVAFLLLFGSLSLVASNVALPRAGEEDADAGDADADGDESKNVRGELDESDELIPHPRPTTGPGRHDDWRWSIDTLAGRFALLPPIPPPPRLAVRRQI